MAQVPVVRPLAEAHLHDEPRLDPLHVSLAHARQLRLDRERRRVAPERLEQLQQLPDLGVVEPGADVADVAQLAALVDGEHERAERAGAPPAAAGVAGDDELVVVLRLDLQPVAGAPAFLVDAVDSLRDHAFEPPLAGDLEERVAVVEALRVDDVLDAGVEQLRAAASLRSAQRQVDLRLAVELEQVERVEDERPGPALQLREARAPGRVDPARPRRRPPRSGT